MKFSYRLMAVIALALFFVALFFVWGTSLWGSSSWILKRSRLVDSHIWPIRSVEDFENNGDAQILSMKQQLNPPFSPSECSYSAVDRAKADIRMIDMLEIVNKEIGNRKPVQTDSDTGVHLPVPGLEKQTSPPMENPSYFVEPKKKKGTLKIILVPHSHSDPGWQKTLQGYFDDQTKPTLDFMVEKLVKYPKMTFIWAESVFLHMWWATAEESQKQTMRKLVEKGQLEIVVGSWVVPDEANPSYFALIDQMIEGHQWLELNLGIKPNNTWSLDPFGYSSTFPYLYKRAGFNNMVILRVHELLKNELQKKRALEFWWRQPWDQSHRTDMFTQMMPFKLYNIKHTCGPDHHICLQFDFRRVPGEYSESRAEAVTTGNIDRLAKLLLGQYQKKANMFRHNVVLVPLGDDFRYDRSIEWDQQYKNYQMLFNYINSKPEWNVQARFGTIQDYFTEVRKELGAADFPVLEGDFFPYTDQNDEYWTGYFTSRPFDKMLGRQLESHLRAADILHALATASAAQRDVAFMAYNANMDELRLAHQSLGLFQHHDAITGTARSYVTVDYEDKLMRGIDSARIVMQKAAEFLLQPIPSSGLKLEMDDLPMLKMVAGERKILRVGFEGSDMVVFNPLGQARKEMVRVLVNTDKIGVLDSEGVIVISQLNPVWTKGGEIDQHQHELVFVADLPALGMRTYKVRRVKTLEGSQNHAAYVRLYNVENFKVPKNIRFQIYPPGKELIILENEGYRVRFSPRTGLMHSITTKSRVMTTRVNLQFLMYKSRGSGAYIFYPAGPAVDTEFSSRPVVRVIRGPLLSEVQVVQDLVHHTVRLYNISGPLTSAVEIENMVDIRSLSNKEIVMRLSSDLAEHNRTFYTDLNGLSMARRKLFSHFPPQANYYPMSSMAYIEDDDTRISLLTAQPLGVTHLDPAGTLEVMLDRRLMYDDGRGMGEGVLDNKETPSRFLLLLERRTGGIDHPTPSLIATVLADQLNYPLVNIFVMNQSEGSLQHYSPVSRPLPCDIHLVNLRPLEGSHQFAPRSVALVLHRVGFHCGYPPIGLQCHTNTGKFSIQEFLSSAAGKVKKIVETSLSLMHDKKEVDPQAALQLNPMELYTYKVTFQ